MNHRLGTSPRSIKTIFLRGAISTIVLLGVIAGVAPVSTANAAPPAPTQTAKLNQLKWAKEIAQIFDDHNVERVKNGVPKLSLLPAVSVRFAQPWTDYMASSGNFDHNDMNNIGWEGAGTWGENIALMYHYPIVDATPLWMASTDGHRENMLGAHYRYMTIGVTQDNKGSNWSTTNFYDGGVRNAGKVYSSGSAWLKDIANGVDTFSLNTAVKPTPPVKPNSPVVPVKPVAPVKPAPPVANNGNLYMTPGYHKSGGRDWRTYCETYSSSVSRCWTEIKAGNKWVFNNLTYLPSPRTQWATNPLGGNGKVGGQVAWTAPDGKQWRTECDTAVTGNGGCRSYTKKGNKWVFNNLVLFGAPMKGVDTKWRP